MSSLDPAMRNQLLAGLPQTALKRLRPHLEAVFLPVREVLETPEEPISHVIFPLSCLGSVIAGSGERRIEVGLIGRDGMSGVCLLFGANTSPHECFIQIAGDGLSIAVPDLIMAIESEPGARKQFLLYARSFMLQTAQTAYANGRCTISERLARWLLMSQDRLDENVIPLTHEFLSLMLGVRRPGVTIALQTLEAAGLIRNTRGHVTVLDRPKLEEAAGEAYIQPGLRH